MEHLRKRMPRQGQIDQSREWIFQTLVDLMGKNAFSDITFSMLAERSGVSRQTIHRHFREREEILLWFMDHAFSAFFTSILDKPDLGSKGAILSNSRLAISLCKENSSFLRILIDHNLGHLFLSKIEEFVHIIMMNVAKQKVPSIGDDPPVPQAAFYREKYFAGGFYLVIVNWVKAGQNDSIDELNRLLGSLIVL